MPSFVGTYAPAIVRDDKVENLKAILILPPMSILSDKDVLHIAKLAKLRLSDEEVKKFGTQLSGVLEYFEQLSEVDTDNTEPTSQVTGLENVTREDEVELCEIEDQLLECSPRKVQNHSVKVPKMM